MVEEELVKQRFCRNLPNIQTQSFFPVREKNDALNLEGFSIILIRILFEFGRLLSCR